MCFCSQDGCTALHLAAQEGQVDVVKLLTEAKAHVNLQTEVHVCIIYTIPYLDSHSFLMTEEILCTHTYTWNVV